MEEQKQYNQHLSGLVVTAEIFAIGFFIGLSACKLFF